MPIYGDSEDSIGTRIYLHAKNMADALVFLSKKPVTRYLDLVKVGKTGDTRPDRYNICGEDEVNNLELAKMVADIMKKELKYHLVPSESARPGYDRRYALDGSKMAALGWEAPMTLRESLEMVVAWTLGNPHWVV
jgi:dTDP-glucose 4,6-dehydratase